MKEILLVGGLVALAALSGRAGTPQTPSPPPIPPGAVVQGERVSLAGVEKIYNPTGASNVPLSQLSDFNKRSLGLALQKQYSAIYRAQAVPLENTINSLNSKISSGGYAGNTLAAMKEERAAAQATLNALWVSTLTPLKNQYQALLR